MSFESSDKAKSPKDTFLSRWVGNQAIWAVFAVVVASVFPGVPTIEPTPDCSVREAERCVELNAVCASGPWDPPGFNPGMTDLCFVERRRLCERCRDAFIGFDMNWVERLLYYGPWWFQLADRHLFSPGGGE